MLCQNSRQRGNRLLIHTLKISAPPLPMSSPLNPCQTASPSTHLASYQTLYEDWVEDAIQVLRTYAHATRLSLGSHISIRSFAWCLQDIGCKV